MAWSDAFVDVLMKGGPYRFVWLLEVLSVGHAPHTAASRFTSAPMTGCTPCLGLKGVRVQGSSLNLASRTATVGAFSVEIVGDAREVFRTVTRGTWVRVRVGFPGWSLDEFQPVAIGTVTNIRGAPPSWIIECRDWKTALKSRNDPDDPDLFDGINHESTQTADAFSFTGNATTTLEVGSTTGFERETSGTGAVKVTPPGGGAPFYMLWTAITSTTFTVSTADVFATAQTSFESAGASRGIVDQVAYLSGHPMDIARKVLTSTGLGWNGDYDAYPSAWGYAIPDYLFDHDDTDHWRDEVVVCSSGSYTCELVVEEPKDDGGAWLEGWLKDHGIILAVRQGSIVLRAISGSTSLPAKAGDPVAVITDDDIDCFDRIQWEGWDSDFSVEYCQMSVGSIRHNGTGTDAPSSSTAYAAATLPALYELLLDVSESVWDDTQTDLIHDNILDRLSVYATRIPERVRMRLPLRYALLAICDLVFLNTTRVYGRQDDGAYEGRSSLVIQVSPNWVDNYCDVSVSVKPTSEETWTS